MRRRKTDRQKFKEKSDKLWADLIKARDRYRCQKCGTQYQKGDRGIEASHIIPRGYLATRWHPLNGKTLCTRCHLYWWHSDPAESHLWAVEKFGQERLDYLNGRRNTLGKYTVDDLKQIHANLKDAFDSIGDGPVKFKSPYPAEVEVFA